MCIENNELHCKLKSYESEILHLKQQMSRQKDEYEARIEKLHDRLESRLEKITTHAIDMAKPTQHNTINNNYIHLKPLSLPTDYVHQQVQDYFTNKYFYQGQRGVAKFAVERLLKDRDGGFLMECSDPSRQVYRFKDEDGNIVRDLRATYLTSIIAEPISIKTEEILDHLEESDPLYPMETARQIAYEIYQLKRSSNDEMCRELKILLAK
jgi:hypothetical protein